MFRDSSSILWSEKFLLIFLTGFWKMAYFILKNYFGYVWSFDFRIYFSIHLSIFRRKTNKQTNFDRDRYINLERTAILNLLVPWAWSNLVQSLSHVWLFVTPRTAACHTSLSIPTPGIYSNSCSLSQWCHPTISSCVIPFSSHLQSFPALGSFQMRQFFA